VEVALSETISGAAFAGEATLVAETGLGRFQAEAKVGSSAFLIDEPVAAGGLGSGPNPYDLLSSALGACTIMTIRLYATRKGWPLSRVRARVAHHRDTLQARDIFTREVSLEGPLDSAQRARLMEMADRCPVHLTLHRGSDVTTTLLPADRLPAHETDTKCEHMKGMEEACDSSG
jgi:putative redox protein